MSGGSSCRPARPPPSLPSIGQSVPRLPLRRAGQTGLGRPAWLRAGRSRRLSVGPSLPRDTRACRPRAEGGLEQSGGRGGRTPAGMGGERQHYYGKHGRQRPPPAPEPGLSEGAAGRPGRELERGAELPIPAGRPPPSLSPGAASQRSLQTPSTEGPRLRRSPPCTPAGTFSRSHLRPSPPSPALSPQSCLLPSVSW